MINLNRNDVTRINVFLEKNNKFITDDICTDSLKKGYVLRNPMIYTKINNIIDLNNFIDDILKTKIAESGIEIFHDIQNLQNIDFINQNFKTFEISTEHNIVDSFCHDTEKGYFLQFYVFNNMLKIYIDDVKLYNGNNTRLQMEALVDDFEKSIKKYLNTPLNVTYSKSCTEIKKIDTNINNINDMDDFILILTNSIFRNLSKNIDIKHQITSNFKQKLYTIRGLSVHQYNKPTYIEYKVWIH